MASDVLVTNLTDGLLVLNLTATRATLRINQDSRVLVDQAIVTANIKDFNKYRGLGLIAFNNNNAAYTGPQGATGIQGPTGPSGVGTGNYPNQELYVLQASDIVNQYINLAYQIVPGSLTFIFDGLTQYLNEDYTLSTVGGVTRITFINDLATGGSSELVENDRVLSTYLHT